MYPLSKQEPAYANLMILADMNFEGNLTPHSWYKHLKFENKRTNLPACAVLSDIVYWYRPIPIRGKNGLPKGYAKKFKGQKLQRNRLYFEELLGLTPRQTTLALEYLEKEGYISVEIVPFMRSKSGNPLWNVMFIDIDAEKIRSITTWKDMVIDDAVEDEEEYGYEYPIQSSYVEVTASSYVEVSTHNMQVTAHERKQLRTRQTDTENKITTKTTIGAATPTPPASAVQPSLFDTTALTPESGDMQEDAEQTNCEHILDATPKQDATSKRVASKGKQKVAKVDDQPKRKVSEIAQALAYREVFNKWPDLESAELLEKHCPDLQRLKNALQVFKFATNNRCNFWYLIDLYAEGATAETRLQQANGNGYNHRSNGNGTHPPQSSSVAPDGSINIIGSGVLKRVSSYT